MTTIFTDEGRSFAATIVMAAPGIVSQIKTLEKDGYNAVQIAGLPEAKDSRVNKAQLGHAHATVWIRSTPRSCQRHQKPTPR